MTTQTAAWGFQKGYQQALRDIREKLQTGGEEAVREWLEDNLIVTESKEEARDRVKREQEGR